MGAIDSHEGPDSMQQESQCVKEDADCECTDPGNCSEEDIGTEEGEHMAALVQEKEPYPKTVTGVIRIMHASGRKGAAEFWEELHETERQAARLLESLQKLHRKKTGCYPQIPKQQAKDE